MLLASDGSGASSKVLVLAALTKDVVSRGLHAGKWAGQIAPLVGGRGGGKPDMAQAGGNDPSAVPKASQAAWAWVREALSQPQA
jgi:alanyl-tRNA synthetase